MLVKSQIKYIQSLGHKKFRDADGVFVAEGPKIVEEFLQSDNLPLVQCFATVNWMLNHEDFQKGRTERFTTIDEKDLARISFHSTPNQVIAVFKKPVFNGPQKERGLTLLLDTIQDPGNLGTIVRTADWFAVNKIICSIETADVFNPKVIQSAMGSLTRVEVIYTNLADYIHANKHTPLFVSTLQGEDLNEGLQLPDVMILMGNESKGISLELEAMANRKIRIPGKGGAESLNVAVATGIILSRIEVIN